MSWEYQVSTDNDWAYEVTAVNDWYYTVTEHPLPEEGLKTKAGGFIVAKSGKKILAKS